MATVSVFDGIDEHWKNLEENIYLHTLEDDYEYARKVNPYKYIQVKIQDKIWDQLIQQQIAREMLMFDLLEIPASTPTEGAKKLTEWIETGGGFNEYLNQSNDTIREMIGDLVTQAIENCGYNMSGEASVDTLSTVYDEVEKILQKKLDTLQGNYNKDIVEKFTQRGQYTAEAAKDIASALRRYDKKRKTLIYEDLDSYVKSLQESTALSDFKGFALENAVVLGLAAVFEAVKGKNHIEFKTSGKELVGGLQQKADGTIVMQGPKGTIVLGTSMKNPEIKKTGRVNIKLQDESSLQNFLKKVQSGAVLNGQIKNELKSTAEQFDTNNFKYHLVNETLFGGYNTSKTDPGKNVLEMVKQAMFYFIGSEFLKAPEVVNNDFMVIGTTFVPVSDIMQNMGNLKVNFNPKLKNAKKLGMSMSDILEEKKEEPVETSSDYYGKNAVNIGSDLGQEMWKTIQLNRVMMALNIKDYI